MDYQPRLLKSGYTTLLVSFAMVALLALPGRAGAYTYNYGTLANPGTQDFGAHVLFNPLPLGPFVDDILFTVNTPFTVTFQNLSSEFGAVSGLNATLYNNPPAGALYSGATNNPVVGFSFANPVPSSLLAAGNYDLRISGTALDFSESFYSGSIVLAAAVPEPETYAMMLAGLGLMGFVVRRRNQKEVA